MQVRLSARIYVYPLDKMGLVAIQSERPEGEHMLLQIKIEDLRDSIARLDRQREDLMGERDKLILQALEAKVPVTEIISASGVNRARIYQIRAAHKEGTP